MQSSGKTTLQIHHSLRDQYFFACAYKESEENVRSLITDLINPETSKLQKGITLENGLVKIDIIRSMIGGKMTAILSGAGGASCQMCTETHKDLKDRDLVIDGFPINRTISDTIELFGELDDTESFFPCHLISDSI